MPYVFLNPDGTQEKALYLLVEHLTGVTYAHQCAGYLTQTREAQGFLIPIGGPKMAQPLMEWFWKTFHGNSYEPATQWKEAHLAELKELVSQVVCWHSTTEAHHDERLFLQLDESRLSECTEGWVPVQTPYGSGFLVFENCD
jgi:hypothetical protein